MIYDKILLQATRQTLGGRETLDEEAVFPLTADYFARLSREKNTGEREIQQWGRWEEMASVRKLLRGAQPPQVSFLVIANDPGLRDELEAARAIQDRWDRRRALRKLARRIAENTVTVFQRDGLEPRDYADPFPTDCQPGEEWFWLLREGYYTWQRGIDLGEGEGDQETWGVCL